MAKPTKQRELRECCQQGDGLLVEPGLLRNVKVLGLQSANGRRYLPEAVTGALALYEGIKVNLNHPSKPDQPRDVQDRLGRLVNVRNEADGPRADLKFNPHLPLSEAIKWWAENDPGCLGLSHNAVGAGHTEDDGTFVVERILAVRSVDLVADPATTKGLFESRNQPVKVKLSKLLEALAKPKQAILNRLIEAGYMDGDAEMDLPGDGTDADDHEAALRGGFEAGCVALIKKALSGDMEPKEALSKLKEMLTSHAKLTGSKADDVVDDKSADDDVDPLKGKQMADEQVKAHPAFKAVQARLDKLEVKAAVEAKQQKAQALCKAARLPDVAVTSVFMEQLVACHDERAMKAAIEDRKGVLGVGKPKSLPAGTVVAGVSEGATITNDDFVKQLKR